jgi:addiction module RelE/StbE family toxin
MASFKIEITSQAIEEIQAAVDYYNQQLENLGARFFNELKHQIKTLSENPLYHSIRYDTIRCAHLHKFPYAVHYQIIDEKVIVFAVLSDYQNSKTQLK